MYNEIVIIKSRITDAIVRFQKQVYNLVFLSKKNTACAVQSQCDTECPPLQATIEYQGQIKAKTSNEIR